MRIFSQVKDSSVQASELTILPCLLAAAMVVVARPRTTCDQKIGNSDCLRATPSYGVLVGCGEDVELYVCTSAMVELKVALRCTGQPPLASSSAPSTHSRAKMIIPTFDSPTSSSTATSPTNTRSSHHGMRRPHDSSTAMQC